MTFSILKLNKNLLKLPQKKILSLIFFYLFFLEHNYLENNELDEN